MSGDGDFASFFLPGAGVMHRKAVPGAGILTEKKLVARQSVEGGGGW